MTRTAKFRVWRGDANDGALKDYNIEVNEGEVVLDVIHRLQATQTPDLAVRWNCKAGKCGSCSAEINGRPRLMCMTRMNTFTDEETITVTPLRAFPVIRDLIVDRSSFDRIMAGGGYVDVRTGSAVDANAIPVAKVDSDAAFDAAACIGCGACVAACKNASAMLFVSAKVSHLGHLPQGQPERQKRVLAMVRQMDSEGFGNCTNQYECEAACPKEISVEHIARMNRDYMKAFLIEQVVG